MAVVDDARCRPYVAEWADASPVWYGEFSLFLMSINQSSGKSLTADRNMRKAFKNTPNRPPQQLPTPPLTSTCTCRALGFTKGPYPLVAMAVVEDGRCRPYVVEWADAGPMWYLEWADAGPTWYGLPM